MTKPLKTVISHTGQTYIDEPITLRPAVVPTPIEHAVAWAFGRRPRVPQPITIGHERRRLIWSNPSPPKGSPT